MLHQNPNVPQSHPLKFRTIVRGSGGPKAAVNDVIDDREELDEYAADCTSEKDRAQITATHPKFEKEKVFAVALGGRPTAQNSVEIVQVTQVSGGFVGLMTQVSYVEHGPVGPPLPVDAPAYPHHVVRVKNAAGIVVFRRVPEITTLALGEEEAHATTLAVGEEGPMMTTMMVGEEGGPVSTMAYGEEGPVGRWGGGGPGNPRAGGEDPSTMATGEEGDPPTTLATGEEAGSFAGAEDPGYPDPTIWYRMRARWGGGGGWGGGFGGGGFGGGPFGGF